MQALSRRLRWGEIGRLHDFGIILAPWQGDPHCDHETAAVMAASLSAQSGWPAVSYPVWGGCVQVKTIFMNQENKAGS